MRISNPYNYNFDLGFRPFIKMMSETWLRFDIRNLIWVFPTNSSNAWNLSITVRRGRSETGQDGWELQVLRAGMMEHTIDWVGELSSRRSWVIGFRVWFFSNSSRGSWVIGFRAWGLGNGVKNKRLPNKKVEPNGSREGLGRTLDFPFRRVEWLDLALDYFLVEARDFFLVESLVLELDFLILMESLVLGLDF